MEFVGVGIKPDVPVELSVSDYAVGEDTVLEYVLTRFQ